MTETEFRCREAVDPPHGHRPVWPPRPPRPAAPPARWWDRLWNRLRGLLARPAPLRHADRRRGRRPSATAVGALHPADIRRILAARAAREQGEEP